MSWLLLALMGWCVGLAMAAPVGSVGVLCIRHAMLGQQKLALATGLGAAVADIFYASIAAFGLWLLQDNLPREWRWLDVVALVLVLFLAARLWFHPATPAAHSCDPEQGVRRGAAHFMLGLVLTLTNPLTMLGFLFAFTLLGLGALLHQPVQAGWILAFVFAGACSWWIGLTMLVGRWRHLLPAHWLPHLNRVAAIMLILCGVFLALRLLDFIPNPA